MVSILSHSELPLFSLSCFQGFSVSSMLCTHCYTPKSVLSSELKSTLGDSSVVQWLRLCASTAGGTGLIPGWEVPRVSSEGGGPLWRTYGLGACMLSCFSPVHLFATLWTIYSPPYSSVHGILQARILEWVAMFPSRRSSQPRG